MGFHSPSIRPAISGGVYGTPRSFNPSPTPTDEASIKGKLNLEVSNPEDRKKNPPMGWGDWGFFLWRKTWEFQGEIFEFKK